MPKQGQLTEPDNLTQKQLLIYARELSQMYRRAHAQQQELERAYRQLQELDRLKSGFLSVITHELRSPFVPIELALQIIRREGEERLTPEQRTQLQQIERQVGQLRREIDNLISFAALLSRQGELKLAETDLNEVVRTSLEPLKVMACSRQVSLSTRLSSRLLPGLWDPARLSEAIFHLVHNAIKFNRPGGAVIVRTYQDGDWAVFEVEDTGVGIPPEKLATLWDSFQQLSDPVKRGKESLGLGLALVRYVVSAHGGETMARSQVGVGSVFGFRLPGS